MLLGKVIGHAHATVKHPSMQGWRLALVQPLGPDRQPEADPFLAPDPLGSAVGQTVVINSDGKFARELIGNDKTPVRYTVIAIVDE